MGKLGKILLVAAVVLHARAAEAEDGLVMLDRQSTASSLGGELLVAAVASELQGRFSVFRFDFHGELFSRDKRIAAVATVPVSIVLQDGASEAVFGNLEGGVTTNIAIASGMYAVARITVALPTASGSAGGAIANGVSALARVNDVILAMPETMSLRAQGSMIYTSGSVFVRADLGVDQPLIENSSRIDDLSHVPLFRANAAVGVVARGGVQVSLESVNTLATDAVVDSFGLGDSRATLHQLGVSARIVRDGTSIMAGLFADPSTLFTSDDGYSIAPVLGVTRSL